MTTKQQPVAHSGATVEDIDAITAVVQLYLDGAARGDRTSITEAFHPDARMYGALGGQRYDVTMGEFADVVAESPADAGGTFRARIASIAQIGDAASVTVVEEGFWETLSFVDFLTLTQIAGRWRIVSKTFAHTGGEPPRH